jgi:ribose transport system substrate-binding protein
VVVIHRFVVVPKVAHPWYDEVRAGAESQARVLGEQLGGIVEVEFLCPPAVGVAEQNATLQRACESRPSGVALDPVDAMDHLPALKALEAAGIPLVLFDAPSPAAGSTSVGNCFAEQGEIAAERLAELLGHAGKIALMHGCPTAPNHRQRHAAQLRVLAKYPEITVVDGGTDNDSIETARTEAAAVLAAHPDLRGYLCCDASGPIGIARAIEEAGRVGTVKVVSMDGIRPILEAVKEGIIEASAATIPHMQGSMAVLMLWQATLGVALPKFVDTGIDLITKDNVDAYLARST